jgi:tetratricopeptide (TPR) repeat protein
MDLSKFTLRNHGFIETENWDCQWVATATYDANIRINFLRNYNIIANDGDLSYAIKMFGHVFRFHPKHVIACICLAYAYFKQGDFDKAGELVENAKLLLERRDVQAEYGKYMNRDEQVINFYYSQSSLNQKARENG